MTKYSRILLAVDLTEDCRHVAEQASTLSELYSAQLHVVHVIEPQSLAYGDEIPMDLSSLHEAISDQAESYLRELSSDFRIPKTKQHLAFGRIDNEIHRIAAENTIDLIVVGSHGRHGLAILFGSTLNGVLQKATCDVLAVRVGTTDKQ